MDMTYAEIGGTGMRVSRLGFGCMRFPVLESGAIDREAAARMIDIAYRGGVNYYDTAYTYHDDESERFLGEVLARYPRDSYYLATKLPTWMLGQEADVERLFGEQLKKCAVGHFDFYLLHALEEERWEAVKKTRALQQLARKKEEGKIRALGFSYHGDFDTFCGILDAYDWDFVQIQTNYLDHVMMDAAAYHNKLCERGIPCVVMEPVRGGFLANLPDEARREQLAVNAETAASWAMRWCMHMPNMPLVLSGMSTEEQVRENLELFSHPRALSQQELEAIGRARDVILSMKTVPCTACGYCMDCTFGVNIPEIFRIYNHYQLFQNKFAASTDYERLGDVQGAGACTQCGACTPMCPQGIAIPERLAEAHNALVNINPASPKESEKE